MVELSLPGLTDQQIDDLSKFEVEEGSDTASPRLPRSRSKTEPAGHANLKYTTDYYYSSGVHEGELYHTNTVEYPARHAHHFACADTIRNPEFSRELYARLPDKGGPLVSTKVEWVNDRIATFDFSNPSYIHRYGNSHCTDAFYIHDGFQLNDATAPPPGDADTSDYGPALWHAMCPAKPSVDLGVFIGEARDLPSLLKAKVESIKDISSLYLAFQFGWKPLLADILDMLKFYENVQKQVEFILHNIGKPLRRYAKISIAPQSGVLLHIEGTPTNWLTPAIGSYFFGGSPDYTKYSNTLSFTLDRDVWGSGVFVYSYNKGRIPERNELIGSLLGLKLTPALVWELVPWSWLIDWFSNVGDVLQNLSNEVADNQVSRYAYAMIQTKREYTWFATDGYLSASVSKRFTTKVREAINPFGLAAGSELSDTQRAILAALTAQRL